MSEEKPTSEIQVLRVQADSMGEQFKAALPAHLPAERFMRVFMTAVQQNPRLVAADRRSLWNAAIKAAQDGLLPDGREGAIVPYYNNKDKCYMAQWMPMIAGLRKKVRNSGEIKDWYVEVVYAGDGFKYQKGDDPRLFHEPVPPHERTGKENDPRKGIIAAYSIAVLKDGSKTAPEVMWIEEIEATRSRSRAKDDGPWITDYAEMCRKTVARRHSKSLPMSTDLDDLIRRDDELYDFDTPKEQARAAQPKTLASRLDALAGQADVPADQKLPERDMADARNREDGDAEVMSSVSSSAAPSNADLLDKLDKQLAGAKDQINREAIWKERQPELVEAGEEAIKQAEEINAKHRDRLKKK